MPINLAAKLEQLKSNQDFTLFWGKDDADLPREFTEFFNDADDLSSLNEQMDILLPNVGESLARACVCRCFQNKYLSGSFRSQRSAIGASKESPQWKCSSFGRGGQFLVETFELIEALLGILGPQFNNDRPAGLVVFAGSTNSAKSSIAQAFCLEVIRRSVAKATQNSRVPHLVTFEDPIESWKLTTSTQPPNDGFPDDGAVELSKSPIDAMKFGFCFTPRELKKDVRDLDSGLKDAKRQTPACYYVGELRDRDDWKRVVDFAGSGHLVVTTTHASSLNETIARIIDSTEAFTPAHRRFVGSQLAACIHLEKVTVETDKSARGSKPHSSDGSKSLVVPSVWTHRGLALNSLVADGLSSVLPNGEYVYSRHQFLLRSFFENRLDNPTTEVFGRKLRPEDQGLLARSLEMARELDIRNLLQQ